MATTVAPTWQAIRTQFTGYAVGVRAALSFFTGSIADVIASGGKAGFSFSKAARNLPLSTASIFVVRPSGTPSPFGGGPG